MLVTITHDSVRISPDCDYYTGFLGWLPSRFATLCTADRVTCEALPMRAEDFGVIPTFPPGLSPAVSLVPFRRNWARVPLVRTARRLTTRLDDSH